MSILDGIGISFQERMSGHLTVPGPSGPDRISFDATIAINDLARFLNLSDHTAALTGTVTVGSLGGPFPMYNGRFNLFSPDPQQGERRMVYEFNFQDAGGKPWFLHGHKVIRHEGGRRGAFKEMLRDPSVTALGDAVDRLCKFDAVEDMTTLFTELHRGIGVTPDPIKGVMLFALEDSLSLASSIKVSGAASPGQQAAATAAFFSFIWGELRAEYLADLSIVYNTSYDNLVLSGKLDEGGKEREFFLVSGVHAPDFPWGDGGVFSDLLLLIKRGDQYQRLCLTGPAIAGLKLDVDNGTYSYRGRIWEISQGYQASFFDMGASGSTLIERGVELELTFTAQAHDTVPYPFPEAGREPATWLAKLRGVLPSFHPLGMHITPHRVSGVTGKITVADSMEAGAPHRDYTVSAGAFGEAERSSFQSLREPTLLYGYICAVKPDRESAKVQIWTRTMRDEREFWAKDQIDKLVGKALAATASGEMELAGGRLAVRELAAAGRLQPVGGPLLEVNNDHFPTAVFQRRVIAVRDPADGGTWLALEEAMDFMRVDPVPKDNPRTVTVAACGGESSCAALADAVEQAGLREALARSRGDKRPEDFKVVIKPNFMFAYNRTDPSTYTDPQLVGFLASLLREWGFTNLTVVEAQSTYGEYFDKRSVREVADYLGYDVSGTHYQLVDLTLDAAGHTYNFGPHLGNHPAPPTWMNADFRISFAKNKTHAYAYYTLALKNCYGALPLANKFKEYHCDRDIYCTTIDYLRACPVHFAIIDAWLSADGPFGIFADADPNPTHTVIAGADPVAVDWVGASKMGLDPMISKYMREAVAAFGKPRIKVVGDPGIYWPWLNVPVALTLFTGKGLDANYHFGNLFYMAGSQMDETHFQHKNQTLFMTTLRKIISPLRNAIFVRTGQQPTLLMRMLNNLFYRLGQ
jgi:uncharacterized protein (DUF362 family)